MDHEGFSPLITGEGSPAEFAAADGLLSRLDEAEIEPFMAYASYQGTGAETSVDEFRDAYSGDWEDEKAFAHQLADDIDLFGVMGRDCTLELYFDWDKWTRDLFIGDYWPESTGHGTVYVFRRN